MAFGKTKTTTPVTPPTNEERIIKHRRAAEDLLVRAAKAGRFEDVTRLASMATAHAVLALTYIQQPFGSLDAQPASDDDGDTTA
jgi:hypothetical protein